MPGASPRLALGVLLAGGLLAPPAFAASDATALNNRGVAAARAGHFDEAVACLRQALALGPDDPTTRRNLSGVLTDWVSRREPNTPVEELIALLEEALRLDPRSSAAWAQLGELRYFRQDDLSGAIQAWQRAVEQAPSDVSRALADRIARAQRDQLIERGYAASTTPHFDVRFQEERPVDLGLLQQFLEDAYAQFAGELGAGPPRLTVIVYTDRDLHRVSTQRDWAIGFYDGRIRLRVDELTAPILADVVRHEVAHAFLHRLYGWHVPMWAHEGYAQLHESSQARSPDLARMEDGLASRAAWIPLKWLDRHLQQPSGAEDLLRAYAESRLVVRRLVNQRGLEALRSFLSQVGQGRATDAAFDRAFAPSRWSRIDQGFFDEHQ